MFSSMMETARNSSFRSPFVSTVHCEADDDSLGNKNLVAGRTIAAASVAEGGNGSRSF